MPRDRLARLRKQDQPRFLPGSATARPVRSAGRLTEHVKDIGTELAAQVIDETRLADEVWESGERPGRDAASSRGEKASPTGAVGLSDYPLDDEDTR